MLSCSFTPSNGKSVIAKATGCHHKLKMWSPKLTAPRPGAPFSRVEDAAPASHKLAVASLMRLLLQRCVSLRARAATHEAKTQAMARPRKFQSVTTSAPRVIGKDVSAKILCSTDRPHLHLLGHMHVCSTSLTYASASPPLSQPATCPPQRAPCQRQARKLHVALRMWITTDFRFSRICAER